MSRLCRRLVALAVIASVPFFAFGEEQVLYPHGSGPDRPAEQAKGGNLNFTVGLLAVFCAGAGAWLYFRNRRAGLSNSSRADRRLVIAETRPLGNRQYLVVADYDGKKFLIGVCPGHINLLAPLESDSPRKLP